MTHPKFGKGFVSEIVSDSKVEVTFKDAKRVLVHNRKNMPGLPLAAEGDGVASNSKIGKKLKKAAKEAATATKKPVAAGAVAGGRRRPKRTAKPARSVRVASGEAGGEGREAARQGREAQEVARRAPRLPSPRCPIGAATRSLSTAAAGRRPDRQRSSRT